MNIKDFKLKHGDCFLVKLPAFTKNFTLIFDKKKGNVLCFFIPSLIANFTGRLFLYFSFCGKVCKNAAVVDINSIEFLSFLGNIKNGVATEVISLKEEAFKNE